MPIKVAERTIWLLRVTVLERWESTAPVIIHLYPFPRMALYFFSGVGRLRVVSSFLLCIEKPDSSPFCLLSSDHPPPPHNSEQQSRSSMAGETSLLLKDLCVWVEDRAPAAPRFGDWCTFLLLKVTKVMCGSPR